MNAGFVDFDQKKFWLSNSAFEAYGLEANWRVEGQIAGDS